MEKPDTKASELQNNSQVIEAYYNSTILDDTSGWGGRLNALAAGGKMPSGLLITGREGSGKHNTAAHMIQILSRKEYRSVFISGSDFKEDAASAKACLGIILDTYYDAKKALCLVMDNPEECPFITEILNYLGMTAMEYSLKKDEYPPLFIILISGAYLEIPSMLRSQLLTCVMSEPGTEERNIFFGSLSKFLNLSLLVNITEGMTYGQLTGIRDGLNMEIDRRNDVSLSESNMMSFVESQKAPAGGGKAGLYAKIENLIDNLPEILSGISIGGGVSHSRHYESSSSQSDDTAPQITSISRDKFEEMPAKDLTKYVFGEERASELVQ